MNAASKLANELKQAYDIIVPNVTTPVRLLSGGNLQRVILAREISGLPDFMVAVQPTRGLDVGAIEGVHRVIGAARSRCSDSPDFGRTWRSCSPLVTASM